MRPSLPTLLTVAALMPAILKVALAETMCPNALIFNSYNYPTRYVTRNGKGALAIELGNGTRFLERAPLDGTEGGASFESLSMPGYYFVNVDNQLQLAKDDNTAIFKRDATFKLVKGEEGYFRFTSSSHSNYYVRHESFQLKMDKWSDTNLFKEDSMFGVVCTSDTKFKLDVCDGEFILTSANYPRYSVQTDLDVVAKIVLVNGTRFKFLTPAINGNPRAVSIVSADKADLYLNTMADHFVMLSKPDGSDEFKEAATFKVVLMSDGLVRLQSLKNPRHYIRHSEFKLKLERWADTHLYDQDSSWRINCSIVPCETKDFVYNRDYENARGPNCEFAPLKWWQINPWCHDIPANRPSPINIELALCKTKSPALKKVVLGKAWHQETKFIVKNNGHSLQADAVNSADLTVTGGNLNGTFNCFQFHFHWGSAENIEKGIGSEHRLFDPLGKNLPTPMEVHIVCKRLDMNMSTAIKTRDAISVLAGFVHPMEPKDHDGWAGHVIAMVLSNMTNLFTPIQAGAQLSMANSKHVETVELQLRDLLPESMHRFVNYDGGFTTPTCNPVSQWHIFTDAMKIRKELMLKFASVFFDAAKKRPMVDNFRPIMSRHGRELRCSFDNKEATPEEVKKVVSETRVVS